MAIKPDYCASSDLKSLLRISDSADDAWIALAITSASRSIDHACNRQFGLTGSAIPRLYTYEWVSVDRRPALSIDDLQTTVGLEVDLDLDGDNDYETALTLNTDFDLWPYNGAADGKPWTHIVLRPTSAAYFPCAARGVQVTGNWGWTAVPTIVKTACMIQAGRYFVRRDSLYGIAGSPEQGNEVRLLQRLDPDVAQMLKTVQRPWGAK